MSGNGIVGRYRRTLAVLCVAAALAALGGCGKSAWFGVKRKGIITMAPHLTETVFALGQGPRVIAVGSYDDYPRRVRALPKVGGHIDPDLEKITMLAPELLILGGEHQQVSEYAALNQLPILNVHMDSFETIDQGIGTLGQALGCVKEANRLRLQFQSEIQALRERLKDVKPLQVLIITTRQTHDLNTLYTAGGSSFVSEMVELAGGENIYRDVDKPYLEASKETVVMKAPEVILEFHCGESLTDNQQQAFYNDWMSLSTLPAVRCGAIYLILESYGLRPGPRIVEVARRIAKLLHAEEMAPA